MTDLVQLEQQYKDLVRRDDELKTKRNILLDREATKAKQRKELEDQLRAMGLDPTDPEAQLQRLANQMQGELDQANQLLSQFEAVIA